MAHTYKVNPYLVKNFSYYNETVFDFLINTPDGTEVIGGGGRYDYLSSKITGKNIPSVGFFLNLDVIFRLLEIRNLYQAFKKSFKVYLCTQSPDLETMILQILQELHEKQLITILGADILKTKEEMENARRNECQVMIILREDNIREGKVLLHNLSKDKQEYVTLEGLIPSIEVIRKSLLH